MAADFELKIDKSKVDDLVSLLDGIDSGAEKALYRALKAVQSKAKTRASQMIRSDPKHGLNLGAAYVKSKLNVGKPSYSNLTARLYANKRGILLTRFPYRKNKSGGMDVKVLRNGGYKNLPGAFFIPSLKNSKVPGIAINKIDYSSMVGGVYKIGSDWYQYSALEKAKTCAGILFLTQKNIFMTIQNSDLLASEKDANGFYINTGTANATAGLTASLVLDEDFNLLYETHWRIGSLQPDSLGAFTTLSGQRKIQTP